MASAVDDFFGVDLIAYNPWVTESSGGTSTATASTASTASSTAPPPKTGSNTAGSASLYPFLSHLGSYNKEKFYDTSHNTPKYDFLRLAATYGTKTQAQRDALWKAMQQNEYFKGATLKGDKLSGLTHKAFGGVTSFDIFSNLSGGSPQAAWQPQTDIHGVPIGQKSTSPQTLTAASAPFTFPDLSALLFGGGGMQNLFSSVWNPQIFSGGLVGPDGKVVPIGGGNENALSALLGSFMSTDGGARYPTAGGEYTGGHAIPGSPELAGTMPPDMMRLRNVLSNWLMSNMFQRNAPYPGNLNAQLSPLFGAGLQTGTQGLNTILGMLAPGMDALGGVMQNGVDYSGISPTLQALLSGKLVNANAGMGAASGMLAGAMPTLSELMTGAGGMDLEKAMADIRTKGMLDLDESMAGLKEQYGSMGLASSGDTAEGLGRASAKGIADINAQQSTLLAQVLPQLLNTRLGAASTLAGLAPQMGSLALGGQQLGLQQILAGIDPTMRMAEMGPQLALQAASMYPQFASAFSQGLNPLMSLYGQAGATGTALNQANIAMQYQDWLNQQQYPLLGYAMQFATQNPMLQKPIVQDNSKPWWATLLSALPGLTFSL
jgi:hypothetical protein